MTWRAGWNLDRAAGTYIVVCSGGGGAGGGYYFEAKGVAFSSSAEVFAGIGNASFILNNPIQFDVAPPSPAAGANCCGLSFKTSGQVLVGWGYPGSIPTAGTTTFATGDVLGIAINTTTNKLWWRNATTTPSTWWGKGSGSPDPVAGTDGFDFTPSTGTCPITGPVFVVIGGGNENVNNTNDLKINFGASAFVASAPTGYVAWDTTGATLINTADVDPHLTLATGNLEFTATTAIPGTNQPTAFGRSNSAKLRV